MCLVFGAILVAMPFPGKVKEPVSKIKIVFMKKNEDVNNKLKNSELNSSPLKEREVTKMKT